MTTVPPASRQGVYAFCSQLYLSQRRALVQKFGLDYSPIQGERDIDRDKRLILAAKEKGVLDAMLAEAIKTGEANEQRSMGIAQSTVTDFDLARTPDDTLLSEAQEASRGIDCPVVLMHPLRESGAYAADLFFRGLPNHRSGFNAGVAWAISRMFDHLTDEQKIAFREQERKS